MDPAEARIVLATSSRPARSFLLRRPNPAGSDRSLIVGCHSSNVAILTFLQLSHCRRAAPLLLPPKPIVQPIVYGATLRLNPLVVFSLTIAAGALLGLPGMILAAPLVSAAVRVHEDLTRLRNPAASDALKARRRVPRRIPGHSVYGRRPAPPGEAGSSCRPRQAPARSAIGRARSPTGRR